MAAGVIEAMFVASLGSLLPGVGSQERDGRDSSITIAVNAGERQRVIDAVLAGDEQQLGITLGSLIDRRGPEVARQRRVAGSHLQSPDMDAVRDMERWAVHEQLGRSDATRDEARILNRTIRSWFSTVTITMDDRGVTFVSVPRGADGEPDLANRAEAHIEIQHWTRDFPQARAIRTRNWEWTDAEILGALQAWADVNGHSPRPRDWGTASTEHPIAKTVRCHFKTWTRALRQAGLA
jgi:hypothetical protein